MSVSSNQKYKQVVQQACAPQLCYQCGQTSHVKKFYLMFNTTASVGQTLGQLRALVLGSSKAAGRPSDSIKSGVGSSLGTQGIQQPERTQTCIFAMTTDEVQANLDSITSIISVFGEPA